MLRTLDTPISFQIPCLCALLTCDLVGAERHCIQLVAAGQQHGAEGVDEQVQSHIQLLDVSAVFLRNDADPVNDVSCGYGPHSKGETDHKSEQRSVPHRVLFTECGRLEQAV